MLDNFALTSSKQQGKKFYYTIAWNKNCMPLK